MPHQCVRCGHLYGDADGTVLSGCSCGSKLFFYVRKDALERAKQVQENLTDEEKTQIAEDVLDLVAGQEDTRRDINDPIVLDFESINISKPGKYEIDIVHLFSGQPLVYKMEDGKYMIDVAGSFQMTNHAPESGPTVVKQEKPKKK